MKRRAFLAASLAVPLIGRAQTVHLPIRMTPAAPSVPQYVSDAPLGQWTRIDTLNTVNTVGVKFTGWGANGYPADLDDYENLFGVWTGSAYDPSRQTMYFHGGGHADYNGNEFYSFDLATQLFGRVNNPSPYLETDQVGGLLPDGLPMAVHTYGEIECDGNGNIYFFSGGGSQISTIWKFNPNFATRPFVYADTLNAWTNTGAACGGPSGGAYGGGFMWDTVDQKFYGGNIYQSFVIPRYFTPPSTSGALPTTGFPNGLVMGFGGSFCLDTLRRDVYFMGGSFAGSGSYIERGLSYYNIPSSSWTELTQITIGDKTPEQSRDFGLAYDSKRDLMWAWKGLPTTRDLYTFNRSTLTWAVVNPSGAVPHVPFYQGTMNKFRYIEQYDVLVVCCGDTDTNAVQIWMYKPSDWGV